MKQEIIRKLSAAVAMSLVVGVSLAACGGSSSSTAAGVTKTGSADGFGGAVTATLTVDANGTVTDCKLEGAQETENIGGAALEELSKQVVAANGPAIDGVAGATVTTKAVRKAVAAALGVELAEEAPADSAAAAPAEPAAIVPVEGGIQIGQAYAAAHGTKCFTEAVAVVKDDVILAAYLDDFQFTSTDAGVTAVPNSDSDFAAGYAEGKVLMSKRANADYYSKMMAEKGGSTVALDANFDAIQNFAVGKTISELEDVAAKGAEAVDAVSGATLVDTAGYLSAIVDAAKNAQTTQAVEFNGSSEDLKLNVVYGAAHGTKCFTSGAVATAGDTIVLSYIDEFQFAGSDAGVVGVPNSDSDFGAGYAEGKVLMSKRVNADYYSKMMAEKAGSTVSLDANYDAIQNHVNGMSIADAEALSKDEKAVDAVSGATGYSVTVDNGTPQTVTDNAFTATGLTAGTSHDFSVVALAALAAAQALGIPIEDAAQALSLCQGVRGRAEVVPTDTDYTVLIDYAHTPDGLKNILSTVCGFADARVLVVFGCGGDRDRTKRAEMGRIAARLADEVIVTSDNPRTENPYAILHEILAGMADSATPFAVLESRREAIAYALDHARTGDVVVLAGKGHETYQVVGAETLPLDERQVVREHLSQ